jgi:hypothetical protein
MSTVDIAKPGTITSAMLVSNSYLSGADEANKYFYMKIKRASLRLGSPDHDVTGDGDATPQFENNLLSYGQLRLSGWMLAGRAIGVANIIDPTKNPITIRLMASSSLFFDGTYLITFFDIGWERDGPFVAVQLSATQTATTPSGIES